MKPTNSTIPLLRGIFRPAPYLLVLLFSVLSFNAFGQRTYATLENHSNGGLACVLCSVQNTGYSVDNDYTNYTQFNFGVSLGGSMSQTLIFNTASSNAGCDSLVIHVGTPGGLLDADVLNGITVEVYDGSTLVQQQSGNQLLVLNLLSGNTEGDIVLRPPASFDRVKITVSKLVGALSSFRIYYAYYNKTILTAPVISPASPMALCSGHAIQLSADPGNDSADIKWYDAATGGNLLHSTDTFTVSPAASTTYYAQSTLGSCASTSRTAEQVNINPTPDAPQVLPDTAYVTAGQSATFHIANADKSLSYEWFTSAQGGTAITTDTVFTVSNVSANADYYVEAVNNTGSCESPRTHVKVIVQPVSNNINCNDANAQTSPVYTGGLLGINVCALCGVFNPENAVDGDNNTASNIRVNVGLLGYLGQLVYFQHMGHPGDSIRLILGLPTGLADVQALTNIRVQTYNGNTPNTGDVYTLDSSLVSLRLLSGNKFEALIPVTANYNGVLISAGGGVTALTSLDLYNAEQVIPLPYPEKDTVNICSGTSATLTVSDSSAEQVQWFSSATGGTALYTGNSFTTDVLTSSTTYYAQAALNGCANPQRVPVFVKVNTPPAAPQVVSSDVSVCAGSSASLEVQNPQSGLTYLWYNAASAGTPEDTGATFTTPAISADSTYYVAAVVGEGCFSASRTQVNVTLSAAVDSPEVLADTIHLSSGNTATFNIKNADTSLTYHWYDAENGGTLLHTAASFTTPALTATTTYYAEAVNGEGCQSKNRTQVVAIVSNPSAVPCSYANAQESPVFTGLLNLGSVTDPDLAVDNSLTTASSLHSEVSALGYIGQRLYFQHTRAAGDSIHLILSLPTGLTDVQVLGGIRVATYLNDNSTGGVYFLNDNLIRLSLLSGSGQFEAVIPAANNFNSVLVSIGGGVSALTTLNIYGAQAYVPAPVISSDSVTVCHHNSAQLKATASSGVTISWYSTASGGSSLYTGTTFTTPVLDTTTTYYAEASRDGCPNPVRTPATVVVRPQPQAPQLVSANVSICSGEVATLKIKDPSDSLTYRWYDAATAGNLLATDSVFTTPALSRNATYYVEADNGNGCSSSSRTSAQVTVDAIPAVPDVSPASATVTPGGSVNFNIQSPDNNYTYNWYNSASGAPVYTGTTYSTGPLYSDETYYVEAVNAGGCASSSRKMLTVKVNGFNDVPCSFANVESTYATGINVGNVTNGSNAVDDDVNSYSTIHVLISALGGIGQQLTFPFSGKAGDSIHIKIGGSSSTILALGLLKNVYVKTFNGTTDNNDATELNNASLINLQLLASNDSTGLVSFKAQKDFNSVVIYTGGLLDVNLGGGLDVYYASATVPRPELTKDSIEICQGDSVTFSISNPLAYVTYNWYSSASGGTALHSGSSFKTSALDSTTIYYAEASRTANSCPNPYRTAAVAIVDPAPDAPQLNATDVSICSGEKASFSVKNPQSGVTYRWYAQANGGSELYNGTSFTSGILSSDTIFYVSAQSNISSCVSISRTDAQVHVNPLPVISGISATSSAVCMGNMDTLSIMNPAQGVKYTWYAKASGGTALDSGSTYVTFPLTQDTTIYVSATNASGCMTSSRTAVSLSVNPLPPVPQPTVDSAVVCKGSTVKLDIKNPQAAFTYNWYINKTGGTAIAHGSSFTMPAISATTTFYVDAANATGCLSSARDSVVVVASPKPDAPTAASSNVMICTGEKAMLSVKNPQSTITYHWYDQASAGNLLYTGTTYTTTTLSADTAFYIEAVSTEGCTSDSRTKVRVTVNPLPQPPQADSATVNICASESADLAVKNPSSSFTYKWYTAASGGTAIHTGTTFTTPVLTSDKTYYVEAANSTGCLSSSRAAIQVKVSALPAPPATDSADYEVCAGSQVVLQVKNSNSNLSYTWYNQQTGGDTLAMGPSFTTPVLSSDKTYYVEAQNMNGCSSSSRTGVNVNVNIRPAVPVLDNSNIEICSGKSAVLQVSQPQTGVSYSWYASTKSGALVATGISFTTPMLTNDTAYYVEAVNASGCTSSSRAIASITVHPAPGALSVAESVVNVCKGSKATLKVSPTTAGISYQWYTAATGSTPVFTGDVYQTGTLTADANYYVEAVNMNGCASASRTEVHVVVDPIPSAPAVSSGNVTVCSGESATLSVLNPQPDLTYQWYTQANGGAVVAIGDTITTTALTSDIMLYVEADNKGGCASARTMVQVHVEPIPPAPSVKSSNVEICNGSQAVLEVDNPQANITYQWFTAMSGGKAISTGPTYTTPALASDTTYYVSALNQNGCSASSRTAVHVIVDPIPVTPVPESNSVDVCIGSPVTLKVKNPDPDITYNWYTSATGGAVAGSGSSFTTPTTNNSATYYVEGVAPAGCTSPARGVVQVTAFKVPDAPTVTVDPDSICPGSSTVLTATSSSSGVTFRWYDAESSSSSLYEGSQFHTPNLNTNATYYTEAIVNGGQCTSPSRTSTEVHVLEKLATPVVHADSIGSTSVEFSWSAIAGAVGYEVSLDGGMTYNMPSSGPKGTTQLVVGLQPAEKVSIMVKALGESSCENSDASAELSVRTNNPTGDDIFVPNAFTPNGDGLNDVLYVYGNSIASMKLVIYNQYGQKIFQSNNQHDGWDGTYHGQMQPVGVYVYYLEATMQDGRKIMKKGSVTLVR